MSLLSIFKSVVVPGMLMISLNAICQDITGSTPAKLQLYALTTSAEELVATSESMTVLYDQLKLNGNLELSSLTSDNPLTRQWLDSLTITTITFTGTLPEGEFVFRDMMDAEFPVEVELHCGDISSKVILVYKISNRKTSLANTFDITVTGNLSLTKDLGMDPPSGLDDKISFLFYQNVQTRNY